MQSAPTLDYVYKRLAVYSSQEAQSICLLYIYQQDISNYSGGEHTRKAPWILEPEHDRKQRKVI